MYSLQKYAGPSSRHTCPACGKPRCFTYYVDEEGEPLDVTVGKCDHESSCNYHKTPAEFMPRRFFTGGLVPTGATKR